MDIPEEKILFKVSFQSDRTTLVKRGGESGGRRVHSGLRGGGVVLMSGGELVHSTRSKLALEFLYLNWFSSRTLYHQFGI